MLTQEARAVFEVLQREKVLDWLVLVGSWCIHFYSEYFGHAQHIMEVKTLDMDFLIPNPRDRSNPPVDIEGLLKPLDFDPEFTASGWLRFVHPNLRVEFLVPRWGPTSDKPVNISNLRIMAMPLRHTTPLIKHTIKVKRDDITVMIPHPVAFALHKLFVSKRRKEKGKAEKDRIQAFRILELALRSKDTKHVATIWESFTRKERKDIVDVFKKNDRVDLSKSLGLQA